jgi:catechol 2,3-dioxygenase-like lactoylglutathione lyase family enzyme
MGYRLNHIHLVCRDLQEMIDFFTDNFGAKLTAMKKFGGAEGASLDLGGTVINLRVAQEKEKLTEVTSAKTYGYHHIGIDVDDIDAKFEELSRKGYAFSVPPKDLDQTLRIAFFDGPEKITIELLQKKN